MLLAARIAAVAGALALCASAAQAAVSYQFTVDTSSLAGTNGFIDFQFATGNGNPIVQEATAAISHFQSAGGHLTETNPYGAVDVYGVPDVLGSVHGLLTNVVTMDAITTVNLDDFFQPFAFGTDFSFILTLSGPAIDASICPDEFSCGLPMFSLDLLNAAEDTQLLVPDGSQFIAQVLVNSDGSASPNTFAGPDIPSFVTIQEVAGAPEATTWAMMLLGFGGMGALIRRRRAAAFS